MMYFKNQAKKNEVQHFVDLVKKMLLVDKNGRIIPLKVLVHPFFSVEQHTDSSQNRTSKNLTVDTEEPNTTQKPSLLRKSVAFKAVTPYEEIVFTRPENVSAKLQIEKDKAAVVQPG